VLFVVVEDMVNKGGWFSTGVGVGKVDIFVLFDLRKFKALF